MNDSRVLTKIERDPARLDELLPWYLNDTLSDDDREWVQAQLSERQDELAFDRSIADTLARRADEVPADIGWSKLLARVRADEAPVHAAPMSTPESFSERVSRWCVSLLTPRMGMALAALLAAQTIGIGYLVNEQAGHEQTVYRAAVKVEPVPVIRVMFVDSVTERQMREALSDTGLAIVDGPTTLGEYFLHGSEQGLEAAARRLQSDGVLASWVLDHKPMVR
ncbi:MAG: hypothetical protein R3E87_06290 [Burkholderiaceae bacterium]